MCVRFLTLFTVLLSVQVIQEAKENALNYKGLGLGVMGEFLYVILYTTNIHLYVWEFTLCCLAFSVFGVMKFCSHYLGH